MNNMSSISYEENTLLLSELFAIRIFFLLQDVKHYD